MLYRLLFIGLLSFVRLVYFIRLQGLVIGFLSFVLHRIIRYRIRVITKNIEIICPEADEDKIEKIRKQYYHHIAELFLETVWSYTASPEDIQPKVVIENMELFDEIYDSGQNATIFISHIGNWELFCQWAPLFIPRLPVVVLYTQLRNQTINSLLLHIRQRFGAHLIDTKATLNLYRQQRKLKPCINLFATDQNPGDPQNQYWSSLFGMNVPIITGAEKFAHSQQQACYFLWVEKVKSQYRLKLIPLGHSKDFDYQISIKQLRLLEDNIKLNPSLWLLSHNRFKHQKKQA